MVFAFVSCNRGVTPGVLRFWHFWSEPGQKAVMDSVIDQFRRENPSIPVEVSELSWGDGKTKLMINFNAETAPDVIEFGSDWVPEFSSSGVLEALDSDTALAARLGLTPKYANVVGSWNGKTFALPWFIDTRVLFINRDLLQGANVDSSLLGNWDGMLQAAHAIHKKGDGKGVGVNGSDAHRLYKKILPQFWSNGGDLFDLQHLPRFASKENIEALEFYCKQLEAGVLQTQKNLDDMFKRGKLGILYSGTWLLKPLAKSDFVWFCAAFPGNRSKQGISFAGGEYLAVNSHSALKREAKMLIAFLSRPDVELRLAKAFNIFPADTNLQTDDFYLSRPQGDVIIRQLKNARMTPVHPKWLEIEQVLEDETSQALYKKKTPAEALQSCDERVKEIISQP